MKSALVSQPEAIPPQRDIHASEKVSRRPDERSLERPSRQRKVRSSSITLAGASFRTSSLAFREALAARLSRDSRNLPGSLGAREFATLVTCNRIEVLLTSDSSRGLERELLGWFSTASRAGSGSAYVLKDFEAVKHLFRVASGLDSMVIGEEQILSQVKEAGARAKAAKSSRGSLSALFDASVGVGKRVRGTLRDTGQSVSSMALDFALSRLGHSPRNVLLIGTGKTARLAASQLQGARLYVATRRTSLRPSRSVTVVSHRDLRKVARKCDLIISATNHRGYLLKKGDLGDRRRVVLDLAFPRNVDPELRSGECEVYNLEDLAKVFANHRNSRRQDASRAEALVVEEAERFSRWLLASKQSSTLSLVYQWAEKSRRAEAEAALRRLPHLSSREKNVVEAMSRRLVSKLLAPPTAFAKSASPDLPQDQRIELVEKIFERGA